jgi:hypothetical protein
MLQGVTGCYGVLRASLQGTCRWFSDLMPCILITFDRVLRSVLHNKQHFLFEANILSAQMATDSISQIHRNSRVLYNYNCISVLPYIKVECS